MTFTNEIVPMLSWLWSLFSSDALDHVTLIMSNLVTIGVALAGYVLARNWLIQRNRERAHDAADRFFDELIDLPSILLEYTMDVSRCAAFLSAVDDGIPLKQRNAEAQQRCLQLAENALMIKLRFFAHFARADKRGAGIRQPGHMAIERALIQFGDSVFNQFKILAAQFITVDGIEDYRLANVKFGLAFKQVRELSRNINSAISPLIGVSFSDYFTFPDVPGHRTHGEAE